MQTDAPTTSLRKRKHVKIPHTSSITPTYREGARCRPVIEDSKSSNNTDKYRTEVKDLRDQFNASQQSTSDEKEATLKSLFTWLRKKDWATSYYDTEQGIRIHVNAHELNKEQATQKIDEEFPRLKDIWNCEVVETDPGRCQTLSGNDVWLKEELMATVTGEGSAANETSVPALILPGQKIVYKEAYDYFVFSGKISSFGFTVGHIGKGKSTEIHDAHNEQVIAEIVERIEGTIKSQDEEFTADISFLQMRSCCKVKNILRCISRTTGKALEEHRLVLHQGKISVGEPVMVLDENGFMKQGTIKNTFFNCKDEDKRKEVINALCIVDENNRAIAQPGQSGALVTSCPQSGSDVLRVYGVVTHIHESKNTSATIANRLWDVLRVHHESGHCSTVKLGETLESIGFTED